MKRILLLSIVALFGIILSAQAQIQTQQGYVKTKGRMVDGKLVPGQGLKGATVSVHGRNAILVDTDDGAFNLFITETQFRLDSVSKKGYQLVDMDAIRKTYKRSSNPLYLVMEMPEQQLEDQLKVEKALRRTLRKQLQEREDEIEALKEQQKISDEEYREALQKLYEDTKQNEQLIKDMVERYSKIDYDQLSEFDKQISEYILNGELTKADSMLRTKGDINKRVLQYKKDEAAITKEREELSQRQEQLEQSEVLAIQERDDLANDCYRKFEIFKMQNRFDSAAYYIELRASLDELNSQWSIDAGDFLGSNYRFRGVGGRMAIHFITIHKRLWQNYTPKVEYDEYFRRASKTIENNKKAELLLLWGSLDIQNNNDSIARIHLDSCYNYLHQYNSFDNSISYSVLTDLGKCYYSLGEYDKTLAFEKSALSLSQKTITDSIFLYENYWYIGLCFDKLNDYKQAILNCEYAINLLLKYHDEYDEIMGWYYSQISNIYIHDDIDKSSYYHAKSLKVEDKRWKEIKKEKEKELEEIKKELEKYKGLCSEETKEHAPKFGLEK